jgi:hypothetical protein
MKIAKIFFLFGVIMMLVACDTSDAFKSPEENYFLKFFGNEGNQNGIDFIVNADGSFILVGNSRETGKDQQVYIAKATSKGKIVWEKTVGGSLDEETKDIELLPNGNIIVLANSEISVGANRNRDVMIILLDQEGNEINKVVQGLTTGISPNDEDAYSISVINGGYIVAGSTSLIPQPPVNKSDFMYMRFRDDLSLVKETDPEAWNNKPVSGFGGEDVVVRVFQRDATTFYLMGYTNADQTNQSNVADFNYYVTTLSNFGVIASSNSFIGLPSSDEKLNDVSISPASSGLGYFLSGTSQNATDGKAYIVKLADPLSFKPSDIAFQTLIDLKSGKSILQKSFNSSSPLNGYYVSTEEISESLDIVLFKRDNRGNEVFRKTFGGLVGDDFSGPVKELADGSIVMVGTMTLGGVINGQRKIVLLKLNPAGVLAP